MRQCLLLSVFALFPFLLDLVQFVCSLYRSDVILVQRCSCPWGYLVAVGDVPVLFLVVELVAFAVVVVSVHRVV